MADFDLGSVLSALGAAQGGAQAAAGQIQANRQVVADAIDTQQNAIDTSVAADKVITAQKDQAAINAQRNNLVAARAFGTDMNDVNQIITQLGNDMVNSWRQARAQQDKVAKIEANATLANPLGLIYDAFFGDEERAKLQGFEESFNLASTTLQKVNQATQTVALTNNALQVTATDATAQADQDKIEANAKMQKAELAQKLAGVDTNMVQAIQSMNAQQASLAVSGYGATMEAARLKLAQDQAQFMQDYKLENKKQETALLTAYNKGRELAGLPPSDLGSMKMEMQLNKQRFDMLAMNGYNAASGNGVFSYGTDPLNAVVNIQNSRLDLPGPQKLVAQKITQAATTAGAMNPQELATLMQIKPAEALQMLQDKKKLPEIQRAVVNAKGQRDLQLINLQDDSSFYAPPPIDFLKGRPELTNNPFLAQTLAPTVEAGGNIKFNPSQLLTQGAELVKQGKVKTEDVAKGISYISHQMMLAMDSANNYLGFGLQPITSYGKFNTVVNAQSGEKNLFGRDVSLNQVVNLADPVQITAYLMQLQARSKTKQFDFGANFVQDFGNDNRTSLDILARNTRDPLPGANVVPGGPNRMLP